MRQWQDNEWRGCVNTPLHATGQHKNPSLLLTTASSVVLSLLRKGAGRRGATQMAMSQLKLFDPSKCITYGAEISDLFYKQILPGYRQQDEAERLVVGGLSKALSLVGDHREHPDFMQLKGAIHRSGRSVDQALSLIPAYRFATDPGTAGDVAHLPSLTQVQGYLNQLSLGGGNDDDRLLLPVTPNQAAGPINFDDLSKGGAIAAHMSGRLGEDSVEAVLNRLGIDFVSQLPATFIGWGKKEASRPDFRVAAFDVEPLQQGFYIEVKWRNRQTNVDDALVALLHNIESWYDLPTLVLYDGVGATLRTYEMVRHQMEKKRRRLEGKLLAMMSFPEFVLFAQTQLGVQRREVAA
jgi:hypothetical protein